MRGKSKVLLFMLLASSGLVAQNRTAESTTNPDSHAAVKGCLTATVMDGYRLADDETGAVYRLIGNPENLRMLVGNDVLITGHSLQTRKKENAENTAGVPYPFTSSSAPRERESSEASGIISFEVINALKMADVCILSARQSKASVTPLKVGFSQAP